jgi:hypothetical protein
MFEKKRLPLTLSVVMAAAAWQPTAALAEQSIVDANTDGKVSFSARLRYESVEQDNALKDADAVTLRTTLGYQTGVFHGFSGFVELEDVSDVGGNHYEEFPQTAVKEYSVVADPDGTEVNQAYLAYQGFDTQFRLGRQELTYRAAPFHRFIGNVLWRQNHQSFDAFTLTNKMFANTTLSYAYINKVNTIFGDDLSVGLIDDGQIDMNSHLFNVQYTGLPIGNIEAYSYLLDYQDAPDNNANSTATYGARLAGVQAMNSEWSLLYTAEYARQDEYADGAMDAQNYMLFELGAKYQGWLAKLSHETLQGDGTYSFNTPLGTNHAYQGWADMFLNTPVQGLQDTYLTVAGKVLGAKLVLVYHNFETDEDSLNAGNEFDVMLEKDFAEHYTVGVKYADYRADNEFTAVSPTSVDTQKVWLYGQVRF